MPDATKLPPCALCGAEPTRSNRLAWCSNMKCGCFTEVFAIAEWTRLHARPTLAPEHVAALRLMIDPLYCGLTLRAKAAIRAALAALCEEDK